MKIFFGSLFILLSANLMVSLLDSSMSEMLNEQRETPQISINNQTR